MTRAPSKTDPMANELQKLNQRLVRCARCPRLRDYCREIGRVKRKAFRNDSYWTRPVPNFGTDAGKILIVGLAPAAHGANRTGRMFTGDQSGLWLYRSMFRAGLCSQPESSSRTDGLQLIDCVMTSACHCAPPQNRPTPAELDDCRSWFDETLDLVKPTVIVALGQIAWNAVARTARERQWLSGSRPPFAHGKKIRLANQAILLGCYHPSQQNTFTGRLTESMLDEIMFLASDLIRKNRQSRK